MNKFHVVGVCLVFAFVCVFTVGCGSGGDLATVQGTVTVDGTPLANASVEFQPQGDGGSPSYGTTDSEGNFELMFTFSKAGATPGKHTVRVTPGVDEDDEDAEEIEEGDPGYYLHETEAEVTDGKNVIPLDF